MDESQEFESVLGPKIHDWLDDYSYDDKKFSDEDEVEDFSDSLKLLFEGIVGKNWPSFLGADYQNTFEEEVDNDLEKVLKKEPWYSFLNRDWFRKKILREEAPYVEGKARLKALYNSAKLHFKSVFGEIQYSGNITRNFRLSSPIKGLYGIGKNTVWTMLLISCLPVQIGSILCDFFAQCVGELAYKALLVLVVWKMSYRKKAQVAGFIRGLGYWGCIGGIALLLAAGFIEMGMPLIVLPIIGGEAILMSSVAILKHFFSREDKTVFRREARDLIEREGTSDNISLAEEKRQEKVEPVQPSLREQPKGFLGWWKRKVDQKSDSDKGEEDVSLQQRPPSPSIR